ncbi:MAG: tRNA modification GTPase [Candidatus Stahlbacteria bacterium]|nr:tRNA modification GTPase [Candidatus Stahlbacteria bacterium]
MDTIAAISTPLGEGGIGIVRISGEQSFQIADLIFTGRIKPSSAATHTVHYGKIIDPATQEKIDEVLIIVMRKPNTYTCEDMIEINTHSGIAVLNKVLQLILQNGTRNAKPGEFTRRAFLSGRIDLAQAEAVLDIVHAKTDKSLTLAMTQLDGKLSTLITDIKNRIVAIVGSIEASIDFPEEVQPQDVAEPNIVVAKPPNAFGDKLQSRLPRYGGGYCRADLSLLSREIGDLIKSGESGRLMRDGAIVPIVGKPNVGKSSLFNALLSEDRAIVTPYPGTTRDTIESWISVAGIPIKLIDTAGICKSANPIEQEGVNRTIKTIEEAEVIIFVIDQSEGMLKEDMEVWEYIKGKKTIVVANKCDLISENGNLSSDFCHQISVSALRGDNVEQILPTVVKLISVDNIIPFVSNTRHIDALIRAKRAIDRAESEVVKMAPELISYELREALTALGEITGETTTETILDHIFSEFCIGK